MIKGYFCNHFRSLLRSWLRLDLAQMISTWSSHMMTCMFILDRHTVCFVVCCKISQLEFDKFMNGLLMVTYIFKHCLLLTIVLAKLQCISYNGLTLSLSFSFTSFNFQMGKGILSFRKTSIVF